MATRKDSVWHRRCESCDYRKFSFFETDISDVVSGTIISNDVSLIKYNVWGVIFNIEINGVAVLNVW